MGLMLTGRRLTAQEGYELGFVNEVVPDALEGARKWAEEILACSPMSVRATKEATLKGLSAPYEESIAACWSYPAMKTMLDSEDAVEGPVAFTEKRAPQWRGR